MHVEFGRERASSTSWAAARLIAALSLLVLALGRPGASQAGASAQTSDGGLAWGLSAPLAIDPSPQTALYAGAPSAGKVRSDERTQLAAVAIPFVANAGQTDAAVAYYAQTFAGTVFVTRQGDIVHALPGHSGADGRQRSAGWTLMERFVGGHAAPVVAQPSATNVSLFLGNDPGRWRAHAATAAAVSLGEVYPGIGVLLKAYGKQIEKVFTVQPGAAVASIRVQVAGAQGMAVTLDGALAVRTGLGEVRLTRPVAYQEVNGQRHTVAVAYAVAGDSYGFRVAGYDARRPVVIDPLLQATYLGGSGMDVAGPLALNATTGEVYVFGFTDSTDFPGTSGGAQPANGGGGWDTFVARLNPSLTTLDQATYLGGSGADVAGTLALNATTGEVYVFGYTNSTDFPGTSGGAQSAYGGGAADGFVARLSADLTTLDQATYLGGGGDDYPYGLALNATTGEVYVAGMTTSTDFPGTSGGAQPAYGGGCSWQCWGDGFVARLTPSLTTLDQATYLGTSGDDLASALALNATTGEVYVTGSTSSADFPGTSGGAQSAKAGGWDDAFVARLTPSLTTLDQATYLGGGGDDTAGTLALNATTGEVYVAGVTASTDFPGTSGGAQSANGGGSYDGFVARLTPSLTTLDQATYLGGGGDDRADALALNATTGEVYVAGMTTSTDFPGTSGGAQPAYGGGCGLRCYGDGFVARLTPSLTTLDQATYLGGSGDDFAGGLALNATTGEVYVAGYTDSTDFPGTSGGAQPAYGGGGWAWCDGFVARLSADLAAVSTCGDGIVAGTEQCDEGAANGTSGSCCTSTCQLRSAGETCRPAAGECDIAETCTGSSATCPAWAELFVSSVCDSSVLRYCEGTGAFIDAFVASGSGGLTTPLDLVFGPDGNLYVASFATDQVLRYNGTTGAFIPPAFVAAASGGLSRPYGLVFGSDGNLYVASGSTDQVLRYNGTTGAFIDAFVAAGSGGLSGPLGLVFGPDGKLYVASQYTSQVLRYNGTTGAFIDAFVAAGSGGLNLPIGLVFGPDGNLYVVSAMNSQVLRYNGTTGAFMDAFVAAGSGGLNTPIGLVFGPDGNLYVPSLGTSEVLRYNGTTGAFIDTFVAAGSGGLCGPEFLVFRPSASIPATPTQTPTPTATLTVTETPTPTPTPTAVCGNGILEQGEQCDDGNLIDCDGCDSNCTLTACGNGIVCPPEQCDDGNTTDGDCCSATCQLEPVNSPCDDGLFCNGADTCAGGTCSVHAGSPCISECNQTCNEGPHTCFDPAGTTCDDGDTCTLESSCDGAGACVGVAPPVADFVILRWPAAPPTPVKAVLGLGARSSRTPTPGLVIDSSVCADTIKMYAYTKTNGDLVAPATSGEAIRVDLDGWVTGDVVTGGGLVSQGKSVHIGGRVDTSGSAPQLAQCAAAACRVEQRYAELRGLAVTPGFQLSPIDLRRGATQDVNLPSGEVVIDVPRIQLGQYAELRLVGDASTRAIVRTGHLIVGHDSHIRAQGIPPEQIVFVVTGSVRLRAYASVSGSILATSTVEVGIGSIVDGGIFAGGGIRLYAYAHVNPYPFVGW